MTATRLPNSIWNDPRLFVAIGFGSGSLPKAPGTWGTVMGVVLFYLIHFLPIWLYLAVVIASFAIGVYLCDFAEKEFKQADHPAIVWDEIVGFFIAMIALPSTLLWICAAFILFRILDIFKPWPISWVQQHVKVGLGVMVDDAIAGAATAIILNLIHFAI